MTAVLAAMFVTITGAGRGLVALQPETGGGPGLLCGTCAEAVAGEGGGSDG